MLLPYRRDHISCFNVFAVGPVSFKELIAPVCFCKSDLQIVPARSKCINPQVWGFDKLSQRYTNDPQMWGFDKFSQPHTIDHQMWSFDKLRLREAGIGIFDSHSDNDMFAYYAILNKQACDKKTFVFIKGQPHRVHDRTAR